MIDTTHINVYDTVKRTVIDTIKIYDTTKLVEKTITGIDTNLWIVIVVAVSTLATIFVTWILNKNNYKYEYYKKVIDKRLNSYELVEILISYFRNYCIEDSYNYYPMFLNVEDFKAFIKHLELTQQKAMWLSPDMRSKIIALNDYLVDNVTKPTQDTIKSLGSKAFDSLVNFDKELQTLLYHDFNELENIDKFIKNQKKDNEQQKKDS